jgi:hypothetical protein
MTDYTSPRYNTDAAARAAGITSGGLRMYFARRQFRLLKEMDAASAHRPRARIKYSLRDALGFAVAGAAIRLGLSPYAAFNAGMVKFAHAPQANADQLVTSPGRDQRLMIFTGQSAKPTIVSTADADLTGMLEEHGSLRVICLNSVCRGAIAALEAQAT